MSAARFTSKISRRKLASIKSIRCPSRDTASSRRTSLTAAGATPSEPSLRRFIASLSLVFMMRAQAAGAQPDFAQEGGAGSISSRRGFGCTHSPASFFPRRTRREAKTCSTRLWCCGLAAEFTSLGEDVMMKVICDDSSLNAAAGSNHVCVIKGLTFLRRQVTFGVSTMTQPVAVIKMSPNKIEHERFLVFSRKETRRVQMPTTWRQKWVEETH